MEQIKSFNKTFTIVKNNNKTFTILNPVVGIKYLIPFDFSEYWAYFRIDKKEWVEINDNFDFDNWNFSKEDFNIYLSKSKEETDFILQKYQSSF
jgi:hypothetical protein